MDSILRISETGIEPLQHLLSSYGIKVVQTNPKSAIPGSYWGDDEAGLINNRLMLRTDTPVHSALHEAAHYVCMDQSRRDGLHTDAGGGYDEENGVCYLQILWATELAVMGKPRMFKDMDTWGYSFRLGSAQAWFEQDAEDAKAWLEQHEILAQGQLTWRLRTA